MGGERSHVLRVRRWWVSVWNLASKDGREKKGGGVVVEGSGGPSVWGFVEEDEWEGRRPRRVKVRWEGWPVLGIMKVPLRSFCEGVNFF